MAQGRSTIVIPVPEAEPLIGGYRQQYDPPARRGMPAHITILYPFLPLDALDGTVIAGLQHLFAETPCFPFLLPRTGEFVQGVLFLEPEPREPFLDLTHRLAAAFNVLPYEGRYADPHPHCTIAQEADELMRREIEVKVTSALPVEARAHEAWLMTREDETPWQLREGFPLQRSLG